MGKLSAIVFSEDEKQLTQLREIVAKNGTSLKDTFFVFDFDYTLSFMPIIEHNGKLVRSVKAELRGGETTLKCLQELKDGGAIFSILTAKVNGKLAVESIAMRLKPLGIQTLFDAENVKGEEFREDQMQFAFAGTIIGSGFNKPEGLLFYMKKRGISTRHLIFVDDCADNIIQMHQYFTAHSPDYDVTLIWWPIPLVEGFQGKQRESTDPEGESKVKKLAEQSN